MKKLFLVVSLLLFVFLAYAQSNAKTEAEIRKLEEGEAAALLKADSNALKQFWAPEFMVNNPRNQVSTDRNAVFNALRTGFINYTSFERVIEQVQVQKDVVITLGHETVVPQHDIPGAKAGVPFTRRFINIWMKKGGKWVMIARQASIVCF